ncbi:hypothetical protein [Pseudomonas bohemica]|nr:hypothetical protein [Pseudomonas bohemica]
MAAESAPHDKRHHLRFSDVLERRRFKDVVGLDWVEADQIPV